MKHWIKFFMALLLAFIQAKRTFFEIMQEQLAVDAPFAALAITSSVTSVFIRIHSSLSLSVEYPTISLFILLILII